MKASAAPSTPARVAAGSPGALDSAVMRDRLTSLSRGAAIVQAATNPVQGAWQGHSSKEDEIAHLLKRRSLQSLDLLVKWMVFRRMRVVESSAIALHPAARSRWVQAGMAEECSELVSELVSELGEGMPDWWIASWFGSPNPRLFDLTPADMLPCDWDLVVDAARLDKLDARSGSNP